MILGYSPASIKLRRSMAVSHHRSRAGTPHADRLVPEVSRFHARLRDRCRTHGVSDGSTPPRATRTRSGNWCASRTDGWKRAPRSGGCGQLQRTAGAWPSSWARAGARRIKSSCEASLRAGGCSSLLDAEGAARGAVWLGGPDAPPRAPSALPRPTFEVSVLPRRLSSSGREAGCGAHRPGRRCDLQTRRRRRARRPR